MTGSTPEGEKRSIDVLREMVSTGGGGPWTARDVVSLVPGLRGGGAGAYVLLGRLVEEGVMEAGQGGVYWRVAPERLP